MFKQSLVKLSSLTFALSLITSLGFASVTTAQANSPLDTKAASSATSSARLPTIISKGNAEIARRLSTLSGLSTKISSTTKLSASDKSSLSSEVSSEISGLTTLKSKLDADTSVSAAAIDAQSIFNDYRVFALVVPKVRLVSFADDQQVAEGKLSALATKLQSRLTASNQANLKDLTSKLQAAQAISSSIESKVAGLQPTDYNANHAVLSGDLAQLKTAQTDNQAALADAQTIIASLK